jgi:ABC-type bacteriocin/lantibiotic exporter with double-glycine peptidase domain
LPAHLGVVLQECLIPAGSVEDALRLRSPEASWTDLSNAARMACFEDVLARMPGGYAATLAAGGTNLSGGEKQRLALAQALVGSPRLLFLDEATSALDRETEARVLSHLGQLPATIISVAHRAAAIRAATQIYLVSDGAVEPLSLQDLGLSPQSPHQAGDAR